jgi:hypothetical protein
VCHGFDANTDTDVEGTDGDVSGDLSDGGDA